MTYAEMRAIIALLASAELTPAERRAIALQVAK